MHKIRILWHRGIRVLDSAAFPRFQDPNVQIGRSCFETNFPLISLITSASQNRYTCRYLCCDDNVVFFYNGTGTGIFFSCRTLEFHGSGLFIRRSSFRHSQVCLPRLPPPPPPSTFRLKLVYFPSHLPFEFHLFIFCRIVKLRWRSRNRQPSTLRHHQPYIYVCITFIMSVVFVTVAKSTKKKRCAWIGRRTSVLSVAERSLFSQCLSFQLWHWPALLGRNAVLSSCQIFFRSFPILGMAGFLPHLSCPRQRFAVYFV